MANGEIMELSAQPVTQKVGMPADREIKPFPASEWTAAVILPATAAVYLAVRGLAGFGPAESTMLVVGYLLTAFGVAGGFHRLLTHRSYELPHRLRWLVLMLGSMAVQGSLFNWASTHRRHHRYSDRFGDPHSPVYGQPDGIGGLMRGLIHAQTGWYLEPESNSWRNGYIKDLVADPQLRQLDRLFPAFAMLGFAIPAAIGGLLTRTVSGAVDGLFWGGIIRIVLLHHTTASVNSVCHLWGTQPYRSGDNSRNNFVVALLTLGEGWHNNHHAFPTSAFHGLRWWQIDISGCVISILEMMKIATKVKRPATAASIRQRSSPH
jgi:stearoyl-CoA desaturase (Delta-9 desaturase)